MLATAGLRKCLGEPGCHRQGGQRKNLDHAARTPETSKSVAPLSHRS